MLRRRQYPEKMIASTTGRAGASGKQSRWIEWDSMIAQARRDLAASPTYADYEKKMWGMARLGAVGDGTAGTATGCTGAAGYDAERPKSY